MVGSSGISFQVFSGFFLGLDPGVYIPPRIKWRIRKIADAGVGVGVVIGVDTVGDGLGILKIPIRNRTAHTANPEPAAKIMLMYKLLSFANLSFQKVLLAALSSSLCMSSSVTGLMSPGVIGSSAIPIVTSIFDFSKRSFCLSGTDS